MLYQDLFNTILIVMVYRVKVNEFFGKRYANFLSIVHFKLRFGLFEVAFWSFCLFPMTIPRLITFSSLTFVKLNTKRSSAKYWLVSWPNQYQVENSRPNHYVMNDNSWHYLLIRHENDTELTYSGWL